jgi:hypothetical protein
MRPREPSDREESAAAVDRILRQRTDRPDPAMKPSSRLAQQLASDQFGPLFVWPQHDDTVARIWSKLGMHTLEEVIEDRDASPRGRFVAAEILFSNELAFLDRHDHKMIAALYARALAERATGSADPWGLLWIDDSIDPLGGRFLALGDAAIPALRELLRNDTVVDWYAGSEQASVGNAARYRIKDFAAFYLARIVGIQLAAHAEPAERDGEIARLTAALDVRAH